MQALEIEVEVDKNHQVHFTLPDNWSSNKVKLIVLDDTQSQKTDNNEIEQINRHAEQLNQEMSDALEYQSPL